MRALVYHGPGQKAWEEVPDPEILDDRDIIVRVDATTICGTDLHILKGDVPAVQRAGSWATRRSVPSRRPATACAACAPATACWSPASAVAAPATIAARPATGSARSSGYKLSACEHYLGHWRALAQLQGGTAVT